MKNDKKNYLKKTVNVISHILARKIINNLKRRASCDPRIFDLDILNLFHEVN